MNVIYAILIFTAALVLLLFSISLFCYFVTFHVFPRQKNSWEEYPLPPGRIYEPYHDIMRTWMNEVRAIPCEDVYITSFDGLTLHGKYYECKAGAPIEIMFHGYRGSAERDLCGGVQRAFAHGRNALIVDQRASGSSGGHTITFGVKESRDCRFWVDFLIKRFGSQVRIILTGISMGASTVLIAAGQPMPENVIGVLADCGYTTSREIIKQVIRNIKYPANLLYPFVRLGAKLFGRFDLEEASPMSSMKTCRIPVIFIHGECDDFVPCEMSRINYEACTSRKMLFTVPGAGHGLAYPADQAGYLNALHEFFP